MSTDKKINILLVDDQPANLQVLETVLAGLGEVLVSVRSGEAALRELLEREFAVVLLDVQMPTMSGYETAALIRSHPRARAVPIIFLTAGSDANFPVEEAYALGAVDHLTKPFNPLVLRSKVAVFIELYRKSAELARFAGDKLARSERQLGESRERFALLLESSGEGIFGLDPEGNCTFLNAAGAAMLGHERDDLVGHGLHAMIHHHRPDGAPYPVEDCAILRAAREGRALRTDDVFWRRDGRAVPVALSVSPMVIGGRVAGAVLTFTDITERTRASLLALGQRSALELAVSEAPLSDVLDVLARTAEDYAGGAALAGIQLVDPDGVHLRHVAAPSLPPALQAALDALGVAPLAAAGGTAAWRAEPVTCADIATDPLWEKCRDLALAHGLRACRSIPIVAPAGALLGTFTWYYTDLRPEHDEAMALLANTASLAIGQRHEAQERQAAEDRSRAILESMSEGFLAVGPDWRITYANGAAEEVTAMGRDELVGGQFWDLFPQVQGSPLEQEYRRTAAERVRSRIEAFPDDQGRWFEINSFPTPDGGIALYFRDETERRLAELGIRRLAAVAEQSSDFIGICTPEAHGIYLNPAGRALAGLTDDDDIGAWRMGDFFAPECRQLVQGEVLPALLGAAGQWEGGLRFANVKSGASRPVHYKGFAVRDADGAIQCLATITRDITEQKRTEDELHRIAADLSEADHRKSEFLATLAHELRNPLAPVRTGLDLLRMAPGDAAAAARVHQMMDRQLGHLIHLVDDLLDVARITRGKIVLKKEAVDLKTVVAMALETSAALIDAGRHKLEVQLPDEPLALDADVTRLVQVLSNLLNNAAKYTPGGGRIVLSARRDGRQALVAVTDSGVGIAPDSLGAVFEMFTQVRSSLDYAQGGLGIGLSLVRRLVELHGGQVSADSAGHGQGSTFTVRLPLRDSPRLGACGSSQDRQGADAGARRPLRVLVVDDNVDAADSLVALLGLLGHTTCAAHDGPQGFRMAQEFVPDLVFLDIGLPGMNGHDVARAIRRAPALRHAVLIALTGWGARGDLALSQEAGFDQHLTKPVSFDALEQALAAATERAYS